MTKADLRKSCAWGVLGMILAGSLAHAQSATTVDTPPASPGSPQTTSSETNASPVNAAPGPFGGSTLTEVVVTANKREENLQKAPIAVTAIGADLLSRSNVKDFSNIQQIAPDIHVDNVVGATNIAIRGVRESALGPSNDTTTAVHLDGVYIAKPVGLQGLFFDVQRLEELKGPQGTLYGRNATGGVVNIISNKPTRTFGGYAEAEGGSYGLYRVEGAVNLPVSDFLDLRVAGRVYHHDGYFANGLNDADQKGGRIEALFHLSPKAKLLITTDYEVSDRLGDAFALVGTAPRSAGFGPRGPVPGGPAPNTIVPSDPFKDTSVLYPTGLGPSREYEVIYGSQVTLDYDLDFATLTAQYGNRRTASDVVQATPYSSYGYSDAPSKSQTNSAELRLASNATRPLQWVGGLFFYTENTSGDQCNKTFGPGGSSVCGGSPSGSLDIGNPKNFTVSYAAFGQATYTPPILNDKLHLIGGVRYNSDDKKAASYEALIGPGRPSLYLSNNTFERAKFDATTYRAGASYDLTARSLAYASISSGFRAGGFAYGTTPEYQPESITAYELGSKNRFFDNRLQVNFDAFRYVYKNVETNVIVPPNRPGEPFSDLTVISIGKVHYTGASLQIQLALTANDRFDADVEYLDAHYGRYVIPPKYLQMAPENLSAVPNGEPAGVYSGNQVINTPPWSGTFAYDHSLKAFSGTIDGRVAVQWSDEQAFSLYPRDSIEFVDSVVPAYARLDLSVRYAPDGGKYTVTAYVNNLTDERTETARSYEGYAGIPLTNSGLITANLLPPRTFGVILGAKF